MPTTRAPTRVAAAIAAAVVVSGLTSPIRAHDDASRLIYAAIVMRHGVRAPTWTADQLNQWSDAPWPSFGVAPGVLAPRGRQLISLLGAYYRDWLAHEKLLDGSCGGVYVHADTIERTVDTARAFSAALLPSCALAVHVDDSAIDPLFDPIGAGIAHPDPAVVAAAIRSRLTADAFRTASLRPAFDALARVLAGSGHPKRTLGDEGWDTTVTAGAKDADVAGPLATASTLAENFLLEYANGFIGPQLAWGRIDEATIERVLVLYTVYADLARRTPALARARASNLLAHVWWSLEQAATGAAVAGALGRPGDSVLVIAGHDTNLSNLSGLLDLSWRLPGDQPNDTPPGGALIFMLWRDPATSEATVKLRYVAQTFRQMHDAAPLTLDTPPGSVDVAIPACRSAMRDGGCPWTAFDRVIRQAVDMTSVKR